jgi:hypothetical protein
MQQNSCACTRCAVARRVSGSAHATFCYPRARASHSPRFYIHSDSHIIAYARRAHRVRGGFVDGSIYGRGQSV